MMKNLFYVALVAGIFFACSSVKAEPVKNPGVISLSVSETKEAEPDVAKITFAVETKASTAQKATSENNVISNKVITALKSIIDEKSDMIKTSSFSVRPNYVYSKDSQKSIKDYTAYNSVIVQVKDMNKVSKLIDAAISSGANRTDNLSYSFENTSEFCNDLYPVLMKKLRNQADVIAKSAGTSVDGVKHVSVGCSSSGGYQGRVFMSAKAVNSTDFAMEESTPVESGKLKVNVSVNAEFYVK